MEYKTCIKCNMSKPVSGFRFSNKSTKEYQAKCKTCQAEEYKVDEEAVISARKRWLKFKYKIDIPTYDILFEKQNGECAICGSNEEVFQIDHEHSTGKIRGLLCKGCNRGLGMFRDNTKLLERAIQYLSNS